MDTKSKYLIVCFALIITISIVVTYYKYVIIKDITFSTDEEVFQISLTEE